MIGEFKDNMRCAILTVLALVLAVVLSACGSGGTGTHNDDNMDKRYTKCLEEGGSFWVEDSDWGCDMDGYTSHG